MTFRDASDYNGCVYSKFLEGPECKASITVKDVPSDVTSMTYILEVEAYDIKLAGNKITFRNVPVYK